MRGNGRSTVVVAVTSVGRDCERGADDGWQKRNIIPIPKSH